VEAQSFKSEPDCKNAPGEKASKSEATENGFLASVSYVTRADSLHGTDNPGCYDATVCTRRCNTERPRGLLMSRAGTARAHLP
jgi:hypothetical protein